MSGPAAVVYDGDCRVCTRMAGVLRRLDKRGAFQVVPSQTPLDSLQLVEEGGRTWQGAAAIERILDLLPRGRWVTWIFSLPFARPLAERFYRWFARNRYRLGCGAHCSYRPPPPGGGGPAA